MHVTILFFFCTPVHNSAPMNHSRAGSACSFFAHPLRVLNDIFDPSKATSARPRKLGLRPQTVRVRPVGRFLRPRRVPKNIVRAAPGTCGVGVNLILPFPAQGNRQNSLLFQKPLHPMNPALAGREAVNWGAEKKTSGLLARSRICF